MREERAKRGRGVLTAIVQTAGSVVAGVLAAAVVLAAGLLLHGADAASFPTAGVQVQLAVTGLASAGVATAPALGLASFGRRGTMQRRVSLGIVSANLGVELFLFGGFVSVSNCCAFNSSFPLPTECAC